MRERDFHQKQAHKTNSEHHWAKFRQHRYLVNKQIKLSRSIYYRDAVITDKDNIAGHWKTLSELTSRNVKGQNPLCIISECEPVTDEKSNTTILNDYFTSIGAKLADKLRCTFGIKVPRTPVDLPYSFEFKEVDESSIFRAKQSHRTRSSKCKTTKRFSLLNCIRS